jgi:hypothetical protein
MLAAPSLRGGRPGGRKVDRRSKRSAMEAVQSPLPYGAPRCADRRSASSSRGVLAGSTATVHRGSHGSGQGSSSRAAPSQFRQRAVRPVGGRGDQPGAQGVALDVAADGQQMHVVLDQERLVAALVQMALAARAVLAVPGLGVVLGQPADSHARSCTM